MYPPPAPPTGLLWGRTTGFELRCSVSCGCQFALRSFDRYDEAMLWLSTAPVRHPPGFIGPCLPSLRNG